MNGLIIHRLYSDKIGLIFKYNFHVIDRLSRHFYLFFYYLLEMFIIDPHICKIGQLLSSDFEKILNSGYEKL